MSHRSPYAALISFACFDLQSHSTYPDGTLTPADVVARAAAAGVQLVALTDTTRWTACMRSMPGGAMASMSHRP
jgi:histidinol phosphatase-like PHP family hydrolase